MYVRTSSSSSPTTCQSVRILSHLSSKRDEVDRYFPLLSLHPLFLSLAVGLLQRAVIQRRVLFVLLSLKNIDSNSATYPALLTLGHFLLLICLRSHPLGLLCSKLRTKDRNKKKKREQTHHPLMLLPVLHCRSACLSLSSTMTLAVRVPSCFVRIRIHKTKRPTVDFLA